MRSIAASLLPVVLACAAASLVAVPQGAVAQGAAEAAASAASRPVTAGSSEVAIVAPDGRTKQFTAAMLATLPVARVSAISHEKTVAYAGADLLDVLRAAGIDPPDHVRGPTVRRVLLAQGADGYVAAFSFAELDPSLGGRKVYLVNRGDDQALGEDGPWRLVVPQDARAARWVRQLTRLRVIDP
jgi:hypothetical protein